MARIQDWINVRPDGVAQLNVSVRKADRQDLADALEFLKRENLTRSKSELVVNAVIEYARLNA